MYICFCELWGHPIGVMVFILYKPYFVSPYTNPTPTVNLPLTGNLVYKRFEIRGYEEMSL